MRSIDALRLATEPADMGTGAGALLPQVAKGFGVMRSHHTMCACESEVGPHEGTGLRWVRDLAGNPSPEQGASGRMASMRSRSRSRAANNRVLCPCCEKIQGAAVSAE